MEILKEGQYPIGNNTICGECGCEFRYYNSEIITDMTTPDEESFLGGFGVHKYLKCPTCNAICTIKCDFIKKENIITKIKKWYKNLWNATT